MDARYSPMASKLIAGLAQRICNGTRPLLKSVQSLCQENPKHLNFCRVAIWTINHTNFLHADIDDEFCLESRRKWNKAANEIKGFDETLAQEKNRFLNFESFVNDFGFSNPTRCGYQFTETIKG